MILLNKTKSKKLTENMSVARTFFQKAKGLLGSLSIADDYALLFEACSSVHMIGMVFAIDVVFLDKGKRVLKVVKALNPFSFAFGPKRTFYTIEAKADTLSNQIEPGDVLEWE